VSYTLTFANGSNSVTVNRPQYGYTAQAHFQIVLSQAETGAYSLWDNGASYDYRTCKAAKWLLPASQKNLLNEFFRNAAEGRAEPITMALGSSPTGFFPFGPDLGDMGTFTVEVVSRNQSGLLYKPYKWFQDEFELVMVSAPSYSLPTRIAQGKFQIGSVSGLRYPGFKPVASYAFQVDLTRSGVPAALDAGSAGDSWETGFDQTCNQSMAAALVAYLAANRQNDITVVAPADYYAFGMDQGAGGTYTSLFLGTNHSDQETVLDITHDAFNQFTIPLNWWMKAAA
jgi:hypothetical protein